MSKQLVPFLVIALLSGAVAAGAQDSGVGNFRDVESRLLGDRTSSLPSLQEFGSASSAGRGPSYGGNLGRRLKAGFMSLVLPGLGQLYNGDRHKAKLFGGAEAAVWASWFVLDDMAGNADADFMEYAGLFAGTSGDHPEAYWRAVGRNMSSDDYNIGRIREARASLEEVSGLFEGTDAWFWRSEEYMLNYQTMRADANRAYQRRDFVILLAVVNRAVAFYDAVRSGGGEHLVQVGSVGLDVGQRQVFGRTSTACFVSGTF